MAVQNLSEIARSGELKQEVLNTPRSKFNLSRARYFEGTFGAIMPFDVIEVLPNEDYTISYSNVIEIRNPLKRKIKNNIRVYFKTYFCKCSDLWAGWNNFVDKGIRQDIAMEIPKYLPYWAVGSVSDSPFDLSGAAYSPFTPMSPLSYMGVPFMFYNKKLEDGTDRKPIFSAINQLWQGTDGRVKDTVIKNYAYQGEIENIETGEKTSTALEINALPLVMYCKIKRLMTNTNLILNNKFWLPDEEDHFRLPYNVQSKGVDGDSTKKNWNYVNQLSWDIPLGTINEWGSNSIFDENKYNDFNLIRNDSVGNASAPHLNALYFAEWDSDYFTGSSPFKDLIRSGNELPSLDLATVNGTLEKINGKNQTESLQEIYKVGKPNPEGSTIPAESVIRNLLSTDVNNNIGTVLKDALINDLKVNSDMHVSVNLMQLRNLIANTLMLERIGTINRPDFYNGYILAQFGVNPRVSQNDPVYIGGYYQDFVFSDVENMTADTSKPLGYKVANGMSAGEGYIGKFHSNNYGYLMTVAYVLPEPIYNGGIEKMWKRSVQADLYQPSLQGTSPEAIFNYELGLADNIHLANQNNNVFGYIKRDESYKWRHNLVTGFGATTYKSGEFIADQAYFIKREFRDMATLKLNNDFVTCSPNNVNTDAFVSTDEPQFLFSVGCNISAVREMMYDAKPASLGMIN